ncbi:MAG: hypothetical protein WEA31_03755 [Pirellulales bacterium]
MPKQLASSLVLALLLPFFATTAEADWFTQLMTIEGGRDAAFAAQWRADMTCRTCRGGPCRRHQQPAVAAASAPESLIAPRSRFAPLPTRPVFEPQVTWVAREIVLDPPPVAEEVIVDPPAIPVPSTAPSAPERLPLPSPETIIPLKPTTTGWKPARPRSSWE